MDRVPTPGTRRSAWGLVAIGSASLVVTLAVNGLAGRLLPLPLRWLADACVPSLLASLALYLLVFPARPLAWAVPGTPWRRLLRLSSLWLLIWLLGSVLYAAALGNWHFYTRGYAALICFALVGPLAEELLFRGAIFELAERTFGLATMAPLITSTLLFSLYHLQLHHFQITPFVMAQLAFTLPMGWVFARLRALSSSIWPGFVLHVFTNLPHAIPASVVHPLH